MLLSCCFSAQKYKKNQKKDKNLNIMPDNEKLPSPDDNLSSKLEHIHEQKVLIASKISNNDQEKHSPLKEENGIIEQRSHDILQNRHPYSISYPSLQSSIITNQSITGKSTPCDLPNISSIEVTIPDPPATPSFERSSIVSTRSILQGNENCSFIGIQANTAEILDEQADELQKKLKLQQSLNELKECYELNLHKLRDEHQQELDNVAKTYSLKLKEEIVLTEKENKEAHRKVKSETDDKIRRLNHQIIIERGKLFAEQQACAKNLEQEFKMKEEQLNESFKLVEERDQAWQDERSDVLEEVQRLKAESLKIINILAMEYEEGNLSEERKSILSQEVYSLQLVVEMRKGEARNLREQLDRTTKESEHADVLKEKLRTETKKMEDLMQQIKIKDSFERQLSLEKSQLEMKMTNSNKAAQRMSQNVEELQWRIKNNFELPVQQFSSIRSEPIQTASFKSFCDSLLRGSDDVSADLYQSAPSHAIRPTSSVIPDILNNTSVNEIKTESSDSCRVICDFDPGSDRIIEIVVEEGAGNEEYVPDADEDGDSFDEGLGDIFSDETAESPVPTSEKVESHNSCDDGKSDQMPSSHRVENEKERRPSRISLETPL